MTEKEVQEIPASGLGQGCLGAFSLPGRLDDLLLRSDRSVVSLSHLPSYLSQFGMLMLRGQLHALELAQRQAGPFLLSRCLRFRLIADFAFMRDGPSKGLRFPLRYPYGLT
jgi:hypothetical protein